MMIVRDAVQNLRNDIAIARVYAKSDDAEMDTQQSYLLSIEQRCAALLDYLDEQLGNASKAADSAAEVPK